MLSSEHAVTRLLRAWSDGDDAALKELMPLVHDELRHLAHLHMRRERPNHTLQTTAVVNEAYLRLVGQQGADWRSRAHFFAASAQAMRRILVDHARQKHSRKRGGETRFVTLDEAALVSPECAAELVALDQALEGLRRFTPAGARSSSCATSAD